MKRVLFTAAVLSFLSCIAGSTVRQEQYAKQNVYTLENEKLIISVSPENGGRGIRFFLKDKKLELVPKNHFGFFGDHWSKHDWPSGLFHLPYQAKAIPGKGKASLKLWITVPAKGGGKGAADKAKSLKMATEPEFQG